MVSQYNVKEGEGYGVKNLGSIVSKRITMRGFIVFDPDMGPNYVADHQKNVQRWIHEGTFKAQQSVTDGIDNAVTGFVGMLKGENFGKAVLKIADLDVKVSQSAGDKQGGTITDICSEIIPKFSKI